MGKENDDFNTELALLTQEVKTLNTTLLATNAELKRLVEDHEKRIRDLEKSQTQLTERLTLWQLGQAAFTSLVGGIVAFTRR